MAKSANSPEQFTPDVVQNIVGRIQAYHADLESERGGYMRRCRSIREDIEGVFTEAKARGLPAKPLRTLIKLTQKVDGAKVIVENLEPDQRELLAMLIKAAGDTVKGQLDLFADLTPEKPNDSNVDDVRGDA